MTVMGFFCGFLGDFVLARGFPSYLILSLAVLLVSADLNEVIELSDSLVVFHGGEIVAYFEDTKKMDEMEMGEYMLGLKRQSPEEVRRVVHEK